MGGEGIGSSSVFLDDPGEFLGTDFLRSLKHHVFEQMGESCFSIFLVPRPNPVPDLESDHRRPRVLQEDDLETVRQDLFMNPLPKSSLRRDIQKNVPEKTETDGFPPNSLCSVMFSYDHHLADHLP